MVTKINGIKIQIVEPGLVEVESFSQKGVFYVVDRVAKTCSCPDFRFRGRECKHIRLVEENEWKIKLEEKIWKADREFEEWRRKQAPVLAALLALNTLKSS